MKILITGDIHIGKRSSAIEEASDFLSTKHTWNRLVDYAIADQVDLVALTGDIIDRDNRFFEAVSPLLSGLQLLDEQQVPVCIVAGNHDYDVLPEIVRQAGLQNVHLLGKDGGWTDYVFEKAGKQLQLIGWSFSSRYCEDDPVRCLSATLVKEDMPTIALIHGDAFMQKTNYAPMNTAAMKSIQQVQAWLLGHIHKPQMLAESPLILYPGSPHALSPKETGVHGPYLLETEERNIHIRQIPFSPVRYEQLHIDVTGMVDKENFREKLLNILKRNAEPLSTDTLKYLVYDLVLTGEHDSVKDLKVWSAELLDYTGSNLFREKIRKVDINVTPQVRVEAFLNDPSYMGVLANAIKALEEGNTNPFVEQLKIQWKDKYAIAVNSSTYSPLSLETDGDQLEKEAGEYILGECRKLFAELYRQGKDAD